MDREPVAQSAPPLFYPYAIILFKYPSFRYEIFLPSLFLTKCNLEQKGSPRRTNCLSKLLLQLVVVKGRTPSFINALLPVNNSLLHMPFSTIYLIQTRSFFAQIYLVHIYGWGKISFKKIRFTKEGEINTKYNFFPPHAVVGLYYSQTFHDKSLGSG